MANLKKPFAKIQRCSSLAGKYYRPQRATSPRARPPKKEYLAAEIRSERLPKDFFIAAQILNK